MPDSRFESLMGRLLDDELSETQFAELIQLVRENPDHAAELQDQLAMAELLAQSEDPLRQSPLFLKVIRSRLDHETATPDAFLPHLRSEIAHLGPKPPAAKPQRPPIQALPWGIAAAAILALGATLFSVATRADRSIARITGLNGSLVWIGDGGRLVRDLNVGMRLSGGTLEALSANAWASLEFDDGSSLTLAGPSMLTISDQDQKELHLRKGNVSALVSTQARGKPMLIHTNTAELQVLGTQLNVEAEPTTTRLSVNKGRVRVVRLVDGSVAEVPARHQIVASADRSQAMIPIPRPDAVHHWSSRLEESLGKWLPPEDGLEARLLAMPIVLNRPKEGSFALYMAGFGVNSCGSAPVVIQVGSTLRIRGRMQVPQMLRVGITARKPEGGFGGKFEGDIPADRFPSSGEPFDITIPLKALLPQHPQVATLPIGSELEDCYLFTINVDAGLEIMSVELSPPARGSVPAPKTESNTKPPETLYQQASRYRSRNGETA